MSSRALLSNLLVLTVTLVTLGQASPDSDGKYWLQGIDIAAAFVPYGASISNLIVFDKHGLPRDVVAGFDNASYYETDKVHPHFGGVPGRYANRIRNSSFDIDGVGYNVQSNENPTDSHPLGIDTLHGGPHGWDWRNFTVASHSDCSITFALDDPAGSQGFPGQVLTYVTYTLGHRTWDIKLVAISTTAKTPIMLSSHTYWNLDGFSNDQNNTPLDHTLHLPYSGQRIGVDNILIPTGDILSNDAGSANDFWLSPKRIGSGFSDPEIHGNCGFNCTGYDNCFLVNRAQNGPYDWQAEDGYVARLHSAWSGIQLDIYTDQDALQVYSCNGMNGTMGLKKNQGFTGNPAFPNTIPQYGCVVLEVQDWIDGINHPEWGRSRKQIFEPGGEPYILQARHKFSVE